MSARLFIRDREVDLSAAVVGLEREGTCEFGNCQRILPELHQHRAQSTMPLGYIGRELDDSLELLFSLREIAALFRGVAGMESSVGGFKPLLPGVSGRQTSDQNTEDKNNTWRTDAAEMDTEIASLQAIELRSKCGALSAWICSAA